MAGDVHGDVQGEDLQVMGLACWLPVPLGPDPQTAAREMVELLESGGETADADLAVAAQVAELVQRAAAQNSPDDDVVPVMAWAYLAEQGTMSPAAIAWLRAVRTAADDPMQLAAWLAEGGELVTTPELTSIQTDSGPATATTVRVALETDGTRSVQQHSAVVWLRPDPGYAMLLSCYLTDLTHAPGVERTLRELAQGVRGA